MNKIFYYEAKGAMFVVYFQFCISVLLAQFYNLVWKYLYTQLLGNGLDATEG